MQTRRETSEPTLFSHLIRALSVALGAGVFYFLANAFNRVFSPDQPVVLTNTVGFMIAGALLGVLIHPYITSSLLSFNRACLKAVRAYSPGRMASGSLGVIAGLVFGNLAVLPVYLFLPNYRGIGLMLSFAGCVLFGYVGGLVFSRLPIFGQGQSAASVKRSEGDAKAKVLDTSVIIDGRVLELARHGFLEGRIVVPSIVLDELQAIADHHDPQRKKRGRRGLDILRALQETPGLGVEIADMSGTPRDKSETVDSRILNYALSIDGALVTNDYNLSRVAEIRGAIVYNLNTLSTDLRKALLPGEKVEVNVVKYGKEQGQGIAYMDDGTMIVIESGDAFIGETVIVEINSMLQTVAGRLIFARPVVEDGEGEKKK